jgi:hypothetical protein
MVYKIALIIALLIINSSLLHPAAICSAQENQPLRKPYLLQFKTPRSLQFCGETVPLEKPEIWERLDREFYLALGRESQVILWLKRSRRYFPYIEGRLKQYNIPDDLKYVAVAESDFYPSSLSPKGAAGFWQFMDDTGRRYGLNNKDKIDDRYSFPKSTEAALTYLSELYKQFGKWTLAIAAYNCGEERVARELEEQGVKDYFDLDLPQETEEYLFRIFAIKIILTDAEQYGFTLSDADYYPAFDMQEVRFYLQQAVHIRVIAEAAQTTFKTIRDLNCELRGHYLPAGFYTLFIPSKGAEKFYDRLKERIEATGESKQP